MYYLGQPGFFFFVFLFIFFLQKIGKGGTGRGGIEEDEREKVGEVRMTGRRRYIGKGGDKDSVEVKKRRRGERVTR